MKKIMFNDRFGLTDAVLEGRKTVTRRIANRKDIYPNDARILAEPQYQVGEIVAIAECYDKIMETLLVPNGMVRAWIPESAGFRNKMFVKAELMPNQIEILDVRAEWLDDITDEDCIKEGVKIGKCGNDGNWMTAYYIPNYSQPYVSARDAFAVLIDKINGKGTWESNPCVFRYEFKLK